MHRLARVTPRARDRGRAWPMCICIFRPMAGLTGVSERRECAERNKHRQGCAGRPWAPGACDPLRYAVIFDPAITQ